MSPQVNKAEISFCYKRLAAAVVAGAAVAPAAVSAAAGEQENQNNDDPKPAAVIAGIAEHSKSPFSALRFIVTTVSAVQAAVRGSSKSYYDAAPFEVTFEKESFHVA